ncbi:MAG TPA: GNAT family N-acetyltransferase [Gammaproteobacteria bacterium]
MNEFRIETPRLLLREWQSDDRGAFTAFVSDSEMMRFITAGKVWEERQIDEFFERQARNIEEGGYCMGAVVLEETGEVIGVAGIQPHRLAGDDEIGWWIARPLQGQGFASEIGAACLRYGLDVLKRQRIVAIADPGNVASIRVMEKIGMRYLDTVNARSLEARYPDEPVVRYVAESA